MFRSLSNNVLVVDEYMQQDYWLNAIDKLEFDKVRQRIMRYASSEPGRQYLRQIFPSISLEEIERNLRKVSEFKYVLEEDSAPPFDGIHPVRESLHKASLEGTSLTGKELYQILSTMRAARALRQYLSQRRERYPTIWECAEALYVDRVLEFNLEQAVDESGNVRDSASKDLRDLRRVLSEKYDQLQKKLEIILNEALAQGIAQDEIVTTREGRMVIPVKAEHKHRLHGFIHSASASGATVFVEPSATLDLNNDIRTLRLQEQREIARVLRDLTIQVGKVHELLQSNLNLLAELDALTAIAKYAIETFAVVPSISASGPIRLVNARHPLLLQTHGRAGTVPLDMQLGSEFQTLVISGPNAGGKSVALKCVGLLTLMVQCGIPIPAAEQSAVRVFKKLFVEIGDEQSIENDLSTFSSHLAHLKLITEEADSDTLVLIDEIGSGTDPLEGSAIASAVLQVLTERGAYTIVTTHHSALKTFAHMQPGIENGAMEFDQTTLMPTYRFRAGIPGSSYALEMAQRLGFPEDILMRSRQFLGEDGTAFQRLIAELEDTAQRYRTELEAVQVEKKRLSDLIAQYEARLRAQASELRELKRRAVEEAAGIVRGANALIERSIREIRETAADKTTVRQVRANIQMLRQELSEQAAQAASETVEDRGGEIRVGSIVALKGKADPGEVIDISSDRKYAVVLFGSVKVKVALKDLVRSTTSVRRAPTVAGGIQAPASVQRDLDLRGMTGEEALPMVDKFIDSAILAGLHRVDIIHGKGTGALRQKIAEFLARDPRVKSYRLGEWNEGGAGATVVELKED